MRVLPRRSLACGVASVPLLVLAGIAVIELADIAFGHSTIGVSPLYSITRVFSSASPSCSATGASTPTQSHSSAATLSPTAAATASHTAAASVSASAATTPSTSAAATQSSTAAATASLSAARTHSVTPATTSSASSSLSAAATPAAAAATATAALVPLNDDGTAAVSSAVRVTAAPLSPSGPLEHLRFVASGARAWAEYASRVEAAATAAETAGRIDASGRDDIVAEAAAAAALWAEIEGGQAAPTASEGGCAAARIVLLEYPINGFASAYGLFGGGLMQAHVRNRLLIIDERGTWRYRSGDARCGKSRGWECYFKPVGGCSFQDVALTTADFQSAVRVTSNSDAIGGPRVLHLNLEDSAAFWHQHLNAMRVPDAYSRYGPAWWRTHFFLYLWRLNDAAVNAVASAVQRSRVSLAQSGADVRTANGSPRATLQHHRAHLHLMTQGSALRSGALSLHVRHGDKVIEKHSTFESSSFLGEIKTLVHAFNCTQLFLSSDDPGVVTDIPALLSNEINDPLLSDLTVLSLDDGLRLGGTLDESASVAASDEEKAYKLAIDAIANIWMLSEGFTFVGIFHSNFGRLAAELQYAKGFTRSAYVFADLASCRAQGHYHPDRDSYFDASAPWYLPLRAARVAAGLPPGLFV